MQLNKNIKIFLLVFFILSIASIHIALMIVGITMLHSPIPGSIVTMVEHMWIFFLFIPIPLASVVLGCVYIRKGYKCLKNIIVGVIMVFWLCVFGSFTAIFADQFGHDMSYLSNISSVVGFAFPDDGYISIEYDYMEEGSSRAMVKISDENSAALLTKIVNHPSWKRDVSFMPANAIDVFNLAMTSDYDYFAVYNLTTNSYNTFPGKLIFMAFDVETDIIYIYCQG